MKKGEHWEQTAGVVVNALLIGILSAFIVGCETLDFFLIPATNGQQDVAKAATTRRDQTVADTLTNVDKKAAVDLWVRLRSGLALTVDENPRINREVSWFADHQHHIDRISIRATPYLYYILSQTEKRGLPSELALLPIVESAYQPLAHSPSGASGLWQFMRHTGERYGLKQSWWYDGRRDVIASTNAALDYLEYLHRRFDGDWLLAIAAYNAGEGSVSAAVKRHQKSNQPTDFWSLGLPRETRNYVPRLLAIARVVARPADYQVRLRPIANQPYFAVLERDHQIDLTVVSELAGISMDDIYRLNPGFNRWATDPDGPHRVLVPKEKRDRIVEGISQVPADQWITWRRHQVQPGETLSQIAGLHNTTVAVLRQVNDLNLTMIRAGRGLIVPFSTRPLTEYSLIAIAREVAAEPYRPTGRKITYQVRKGDSLWLIARRHDTRVKKLVAWNGLSADIPIRPGQRLVIWYDSAPARVTGRWNGIGLGARRSVPLAQAEIES